MNHIRRSKLQLTKKLASGSRLNDFYWVTGTMMLIMLAAGIDASLRMFLAVNMQSGGSTLPFTDLWSVVDVRSILLFILSPIIAVVILPSRNGWVPSWCIHLLLVTTIIIVFGTYVHRLEHYQSAKRILFAWGKIEPPYELAGCHGTVLFWLGEVSRDLAKYLLLLAVGSAVYYARTTRRRTLQTKQLEQSLLLARHDTLASQLQPHFLFNSLNSISGLTLEDPAAARECIGHLGSLLQHSVNRLPERGIPLSEEIAILKKYLAIQKARFGDRLEHDIQVDKELFDVLVPAFMLQPIVENSFKHGFDQIDHVAHLSVSATRRGNDCVIEICDNGRCKNPSYLMKEGGGLGMTRERLELQYGDRCDVSFDHTAGGGLSVTLLLPLDLEVPAD